MHMNMPVYSSVWRMRDLKASQRACDLCNACIKAKKISAGSGPASKTESPHRLTEPHTDNSHYMLYTYI